MDTPVWFVSLVRTSVVSVLLVTSLSTSHAFSPRNIRNCTSCRKTFGKEIQQIRRLHVIRNRIENALNIDGQTNRFGAQASASLINDNKIASVPETEEDEIISFSHTIGRKADSSLLEFVIHTRNVEKNVQVVSANLWVLVKKKGKHRRGKRIVLKVFHLSGHSHFLLTYLRTKVRKTRWQKLSLPISLIQNMVHPPLRKLQLRVDCRRCGSKVKLVLPKDRHKKKRKRDNMQASLRGLRASRTNKRRPFLHIFTRVKEQDRRP